MPTGKSSSSRSIDAQLPVLAILAGGFALIAVAAYRLHWPVDGAISGAATWLTLVLLGVAVRNLLVVAGRGRAAVLSPPQRLGDVLAATLPPVAFLGGLVFGRLFWH